MTKIISLDYYFLIILVVVLLIYIKLIQSYLLILKIRFYYKKPIIYCFSSSKVSL